MKWIVLVDWIAMTRKEKVQEQTSLSSWGKWQVTYVLISKVFFYSTWCWYLFGERACQASEFFLLEEFIVFRWMASEERKGTLFLGYKMLYCVENCGIKKIHVSFHI